MLAGSVAGVVEHCGMFPLDTIKVGVSFWRMPFLEAQQRCESAVALTEDVKPGSSGGIEIFSFFCCFIFRVLLDAFAAGGSKLVHEKGCKGDLRPTWISRYSCFLSSFL
jgi:hypothetical protein